MSSFAPSTSTPAPSTSNESPRAEALPLPQKVGEIGYVPLAESQSEFRQVNLNEPITTPARHPADRDNVESVSSNQSSSTSTTNQESQPKRSHSWTFGGVSIWSYLRFSLLLVLIAGTGVAWWYTVKRFQDTMAASPMTQDQGNGFGFSSTIFVHVAFGIVALFEFIFLERNVFHIRAERYMFKHGMSRDARRAATLGIAPWHRPPLPTYAAALAESGRGTGDVEDNLIAIVPPPAYGNTRGSMLLLSSVLSSNLVRSLSRASQNSARPRSPEAEMEEGRRGGSRPVSYGTSEEVSDAARARELEVTLARLGNTSQPQPAASTSTSH